MRDTRRLFTILLLAVTPAAAGAQYPSRAANDWPDAAVAFDAVVSAFERQYALFHTKSLPWPEVAQAYRERALAAATEDEFFQVVADLLASLNDNHVKLIGWSRIMSAAGSLRGAAPPDDFSAELIRRRYLLAAPERRVRGLVVFGWLPDSVGYIHISGVTERDASIAALDDALATFAEARGVVLDLRGNLGGDDDVGQALAARFADRPRHYMTTRLKSGPGPDDFTAPRYWSIGPPVGGGYVRPVVVLTHAFTFSAAENLLLALRTLPHVTVVGTRSSGSMGETTNDVLPNGWVYRTVIQEIVDADGRSWEGLGIPPAVHVVNSAAEIADGRDAALETAHALVASAAAAHARATRPSDGSAARFPLSLADSLASWIESRGLEAAMRDFERVRADTARWFLAEDWEYGDLTTLGRRLLDEGRDDAAVAVLEAAASAYPRSYRPHLWLARAHARGGRERQAEAARERALALDPQLYPADRRAAIELRGRIPLGHRFLDRLFREGADAAIAEYRATMAEAPERSDVDVLLLVRGGQQMREAGQSEEARRVFAFVAEQFPDRVIGHLGLAEALRRLGDVDGARRAYERALALDPDNRAAREGRARLARE